jgi:hypothetical protein
MLPAWRGKVLGPLPAGLLEKHQPVSGGDRVKVRTNQSGQS